MNKTAVRLRKFRIAAICFRIIPLQLLLEFRMNQAPVWFERKFEFTFPAEQHPNLCVRLRGTPARLEEIVRAAGRDALIRKPDAKWSAQEHAGHLLDLESLWTARVDDYLTGASRLTVADLTNRKTHEAQHNQQPIEAIMADFREARMRLVNRAENIDPAIFARAIPHPRLQTPMRLVDHLYFVAEHDDHHLSHIWALVNGH
jgi:DinB superfamily